jgi:hypothetical protein
MIGMWWPLILILPVALFLSLQLMSPIEDLKKRLFQREMKKRKLLLIQIAALVFVIPISIPIIRALTSMSVRDFFVVKGGLHLASNSLLVASSLSLLVLIFLLESKEAPQYFPNNAAQIFTSTIALTGVLASVLYVVSLFVGPEFAQNYSVQKVMLLFALAGAPILIVTVNSAAERIGRPNISLVAIPLAFFLGALTIGWNLNSPRVLTPPAWGVNLLRVADENPGAVILSRDISLQPSCSSITTHSGNFVRRVASRSIISDTFFDCRRFSYSENEI